jgi:CHAT domain-containing protein/tetratricopeptide (TPR) repeat protein
MTLCHLFFGAAALLLPGNVPGPEPGHYLDTINVTLNVSRQEMINQQGHNKPESQKAPEKSDESGKSAPEQLMVAGNLFQQGSAALQSGDLATAAEYFRKSLAIHEKLAPLNLELAKDLNGLGDISQQRGEARTAQELYEQALSILRKVAPDGVDFAHSLNGLGRAALDVGDRSQAGAYLLQALAIRQKLEPDGLETAAILNNLGDWYRRREEPAKAEQSLRQAVAIEERLATESLAAADTLTGLGALAVGSDSKKAETYHRQALALREKLSPNSLAVANSLWWLGACSADVAKSEAFHRRAVEIQRALAPGGVFLARGLNFLSYFFENRGDLPQAGEHERQALAILEKQAPGSLMMATSLEHLGRMRLREGELEVAEDLVRRALQITEKLQPGGYEEAENLSSLGDLYYRRGELDKAEQSHRRALDIREKLAPGDALYTSSLRNLGYVANARGDLDKAEQYHRQALEIRERLLPDSVEVANSLSDLGDLALERGDWSKAEQYQQKALKLWEKIVPGSLYVAQGYSALGNIAQRQGDLARAEEHQRRALNIWEKLVPGTTSFASGLSNLGDVIRERGDPVKAEEYQRQALAIEQKQASGSPFEAAILVQLGHSIQDRGDLANAEDCYRQALTIREKFAPGSAIHAETLAALAKNMRRQNRAPESAEFYEQALNALESQTARLGGGDEIRSGFRANHASYYTDYLDLLVTQHKPEIAFHVLERFRARSLLETLSSARVDIRTGVDSALVERERSLQQSLAAKSDRRLRMLSEKHSEQQIAAITGEIAGLLSQYNDVEEQLRANSPGYAALTQPHPLNARQVQEQLLDADTLLLEYSLGEERSYVFKVDEGSVVAYALPKRDEIERAARRVYDLLTVRNHMVKGETEMQKQARMNKAEAEFSKAAGELSHMALGPLAGQLGEKRLLIVSDGALQYIPFAVLPSPRISASPEISEPLLVKHEIVNLPSASVLAVLRREEKERKAPLKEVIALADPVFDKQDRRVVTRGASNTRDEQAPLDHLTRSLEDVGGELRLHRLPFTRLEADAIMAVTPHGKGMEAVDFRASRAAVISPQLAQYRIVHFATHGLLDSKHPELSGLVMSLVDEKGHSQNGFLELQDIYNLSLPVELVVLSACETGLGKEISGEGLIGLTRGFMYAGASRVVASLWSVSDIATAKLMAQFYKGMERGRLSPAAALRTAQINLWRQQRWSSPYYWAAFQIQGEWR